MRLSAFALDIRTCLPDHVVEECFDGALRAANRGVLTPQNDFESSHRDYISLPSNR